MEGGGGIMEFVHASLFSGIGGFDLASEWMGWTNLFHCEINPFCQKVLKYHFPTSISYNDITTTDFTIHRGRVDILTGGFPCQPFSAAGKRKGTEDNRHLWPEMLRAIREIQPCNVVGENVRGLTNWNGGLVFDQVQADLEAEGYEVLPFLLPACAVNAPHRRDRIWFVAYSNGNGQNDGNRKNEIHTSETGKYAFNDFKPFCVITNSYEKQLNAVKSTNGKNKINGFKEKVGSKSWHEFELVSSTEHSGIDFYNGHDFEPTIIRVDDGLPEKLDELESFGNAIVPQVAYEIFKSIQLTNKNFNAA